MLVGYVGATVQIEGQTYYTHTDIHWNKDLYGGYGGYISIRGLGYFYCTNHNSSLTGHLADDSALVANELIDEYQGSENRARERAYEAAAEWERTHSPWNKRNSKSTTIGN